MITRSNGSRSIERLYKFEKSCMSSLSWMNSSELETSSNRSFLFLPLLMTYFRSFLMILIESVGVESRDLAAINSSSTTWWRAYSIFLTKSFFFPIPGGVEEPCSCLRFSAPRPPAIAVFSFISSIALVSMPSGMLKVIFFFYFSRFICSAVTPNAHVFM